MVGSGCTAAHSVTTRRMCVVGMCLEHEHAVHDGFGVVVSGGIYVSGKMCVVVGE